MTTKINLLTCAATAALFCFASCQKEKENIAVPDSSSSSPDISEKGTNPDDEFLSNSLNHWDWTGYLYTQDNESGTNYIHIYKQHADGHLTPQGTVASGGGGSGAALGSQGALALSNDHMWLFAVNAGSNSVSVFHVLDDGSLVLSDTKMSGTTPVSICFHNQLLYVVNAGSSNINGYILGAGGTLEGIVGSQQPLSSPIAGPAQIAFSPNGEYLYVTEKMTNKITSFEVNENGVAQFDTSFSSAGITPFGFSIARDNFMVVSNAANGSANASSCTSYKGIDPGNLVAANGTVPNNQTAACWVATTKYGRFAYVSNTGSDNISSYYVSPWGNIYLVHSSAVNSGDAPADIVVAANNFYVYNINVTSHTITGYHRWFLGDLVAMGTTTGLPTFAAGLVAW